MNVHVIKTTLGQIIPFRNLYLSENHFEIRYNACHERGWSDAYLISVDDRAIGYGSVKGRAHLQDRDTIFEFYVVPFYRKHANRFFQELILACAATFIECQTNDELLFSLNNQFSENLYADTILFEDHQVTTLQLKDVLFRARKNEDRIFDHTFEPDGPYVLERHGAIVASGGFMLHYNMPFADIYMEVEPNWRRQGLGSFLTQELKKACYLSGRVPAARCALDHHASKATLIKAGLKISGFMQIGKIKKQ